MNRVLRPLLFAVSTALAPGAAGGCGARPSLDESGGVCGLPPLAANGPFTEDVCTPGVCTLGARDTSGAAVELVCEVQRCRIYVDHVERCTCTDLDYDSTCANGIPICLHRANFDFAATEPVTCTGP